MSRQYKPKAGFWIRLCVVVLFPVDSLLFRIRWQRLERMPPPSEGGVIIALNHVSHIDTVLMARLVWSSGRVPRFMIKAGVFAKPVLGQIMRGAGQIPVHRGTTDAASSLDDAVTALERGEAVVIYPEGTITKDPAQWPMEAKTGIARLVLLCPDTPVVPVGQWGAQPTKGLHPLRLFRRPLVQASVGETVDLSKFRGAQPDAATLREITDTVMSAVRVEVAALRGESAPEEFFKPAKRYVDRT
ncbi:MAG: lysophospholipid acyltransferase family protein [Pseudonocardiales bacterium]|nr:1-acyl-sn-glycerol-3-phosphate acyltransferase [Actinomycetota bacterium]